MDANSSTTKNIVAIGFFAVAAYVFYDTVLAGDDTPVDDQAAMTFVDPASEEGMEETYDPGAGRSGSRRRSDAGSNGGGDSATTVKLRKGRSIRLDLLPKYGVYSKGATVKNPFRPPLAVDVAMSRARGGANAVGSESWAPPEHRVSMVMQAGAVRRATIDGAVYGVDDQVGGGEVRRIERDGVEISLDGTLLFYELQNPWPRGYEPPPTSEADSGEQPEFGEPDVMVEPTVNEEGKGR